MTYCVRFSTHKKLLLLLFKFFVIDCILSKILGLSLLLSRLSTLYSVTAWTNGYSSLRSRSAIAEVIGQSRGHSGQGKQTVREMCCVDICEKVRRILEPLGFECYPFKVN